MSRPAASADDMPAGGVQRPLSVAAVAAAFRQLTLLGAAPASDKPGRSLLWYPLVGLSLGGLWLAVDLLVAPLAGTIASSIAVAMVAVVITRHWPCRGAGETLTLLWSAPRPRRLAADAHGGASIQGGAAPRSTGGLIVAGVFWLSLLACLLSVDRWRPIGLVCAPLLGRWAMVVLAFGSRAARPDGKPMKFAKGVTFEEFGWASTATLGLIFWGTGLLGILLLVCTAIPIVGLRVWLHRRLDGINVSAMGAACAVAEIVPLLVLAQF